MFKVSETSEAVRGLWWISGVTDGNIIDFEDNLDKHWCSTNNQTKIHLYWSRQHSVKPENISSL